MKKKFSTYWVGSKKPRKQVKYRANAPLHIKHGMLSTNLNKDLRKKHGRRSFPIRKGDSVKIMNGEFKGRTGKVDRVNTKKLMVAIEGMQRSKKDGSKVNVYFNTSKLQIQSLNLDDKKRIESLNKEKKETKTENKPMEKKNAPQKK